MKRVTLVTGPIASGKSAVCQYLSGLSYPVYDCDSRVKALYQSREGLVKQIERELGVDFSKLTIIFTDDAKRTKLESIVYPILLEDMLSWIESQDAKHLFIESAIALEKELFDNVYDDVLIIISDLSVRMERNPKVQQRDSLQHVDTSRADYIINNESTIEQLHKKIDKYLNEYENRSC